MGEFRRAGADARRAADPSGAALDACWRRAQAGVEVIGDIELFCRERRRHAPDAPFVAITGTNGKSTTTALIAHLMRVAGYDTQMGGNIGTAILSLEPPRMGRVHVIEMSSYQIDLAPSLDPSVGILLNVSEDHIDRHGTLEHYAAVKERLVAGVQPQGTAIVGVDDGWCRNIADRIEQAGKRVVRVSVKNPLADGIYVERETIVRAAGGARSEIARIGGIGSLRGLHNAQNAACAVGLRAGARRQRPRCCRTACAVFPASRTAWSRSAAAATCCSSTTPRAPMRTPRRMRCRPSPTSSGSPAASRRRGGITGLDRIFPAHPQSLSDRRGGAGIRRHARRAACRTRSAQTLDVAVANAARDAEASGLADPVVLLSPACASFDQYRNFEIRGAEFRDLVTALPGVKPVV